jgi:hypothetical protein
LRPREFLLSAAGLSECQEQKKNHGAEHDPAHDLAAAILLRHARLS